ncbi:sensor histidine kinase [Demequina soli]|uniref:sensor histidine kinase n=1 Tax=Demequina soli TaxID=1638987 RepID=UPI000784006C|nr:sensor domain-containing protein [Demequina soli]
MDTPAPHDRPWLVQQIIQMGRDLGYLLPLLPLATVAFTAVLTLLMTSISLVIVWVGVPLGVATLWAARGLADFERLRLGALGRGPVIGIYTRPDRDASRFRRFFHPLRDGQMWLDVLHALVVFPVAVASWSITVAWASVAFVGSTAWIWEAFADADDLPAGGTLPWLTSPLGHTVIGLLALACLPVVVRGLALLHLAIGRGLLGASEERRLRAEVERLEHARGAAAAAESSALRRIERDLHDGPQQRLIRLQMDAERAERQLDTDPEAARAALAEIRGQAAETLAELRAMTRGFAPPMLAERGLLAAVESLAERSTVPVAVEADIPEGLGVAVETAAYFVVSEALANVAKHAEASAATVGIAMDGDHLLVVVTDDGRGGAHLAKGHGLAGLADRVAGAGGTLAVADAPAGGTILTARVPVG